MTSSPPKWRQFEKKAYEIQKSLSAADADVKHNDLIFGSDSKTNRQIDISIRSNVGSYSILIIAECKDCKIPLDVKDVGEFVITLRDVRANKGVMISAKGFTEAAKNLAEHHDIDLRQLIDTESVEWGTNVSLPCLLERTYMVSCSLEVHDFNELPLGSDKVMALELTTESGESIGNAQDVLHRKWDNHEVPHSVGTHKVAIGTNLFTEFNGVAQTGSIYAHVFVEKAFYSGIVPIHFQGFINVKSGGLITRQILTGVISPIAIEKGEIPGWKLIDNPSDLSPSPAFTIGYFDVYFPPIKQTTGAGAVWPEQEAKR